MNKSIYEVNLYVNNKKVLITIGKIGRKFSIFYELIEQTKTRLNFAEQNLDGSEGTDV